MRPNASVVGSVMRSPANNAEVPSPPSDMGWRMISVSLLRTSRIPVAIWWATSWAEAEVLNESGAITIRMWVSLACIFKLG